DHPPTSVGDCHWTTRGWPGRDPAYVSNSADTERLAAEATRYLREFALPEFDKLIPAAKFHQVLYNTNGAGPGLFIICERVLMEWAMAEGKSNNAPFVGKWMSDPSDVKGIRRFGCGTFEFYDDGRLTYMTGGEEASDKTFFTYYVASDAIVT